MLIPRRSPRSSKSNHCRFQNNQFLKARHAPCFFHARKGEWCNVALSEKQRAFCEHYASCLNATEAAKRAGYSAKTARSIGAENLTKPDIQKYIAELTKPKQECRIATIDEVLQYLSDTMRRAEELTRERTKAAQLLIDVLSECSAHEVDDGIKVVIERKIVDLSKDKQDDGD